MMRCEGNPDVSLDKTGLAREAAQRPCFGQFSHWVTHGSYPAN